MQLFANNGTSTLAAALTAAATTLSVQPGQGARFPSPTNGDFFVLTLFQMTGGIESNYEIVKVTARSVDTLTVVRAQEGTTAQAYNVGDQVSARNTAGTLGGFATSIAGKANLAGNAAQNFAAADMAVSSVNGGPLAGFRNMLINGDMHIDQRGQGGAGYIFTANQYGYTIDRWGISNTAGTVTLKQDTDAPPGFLNSLLVTCTATGVPAANSGSILYQNIEGFSTERLAYGTPSAKTSVLSFWIKASIAGSYGVNLRNNALTRYFSAQVSVPTANVWTYVSVVIPGCTDGVWNNDANRSVYMSWDLGCDAGIASAATNGWAVGQSIAVAGDVKLISNLNATLRIAGVQFEQGPVATPYERRSYSIELAMCQRYFEAGRAHLLFSSTASGQYVNENVRFKTTKRVAPQITFNMTYVNNLGAPILINSWIDCFAYYAASLAAVQAAETDGTFAANAEV